MKKILLSAVAALALAGCNSSKHVVYMQDVELDKAVPVENYNEVKVRPGDMISITVSCKEPALAAMFNPTTTGRSGGNSSSMIGRSGSMVGMSVNSSGSNNSEIPYTINSKGDINFPVLGPVHVAGLNREQIADLIKKRIIDGNYIEDPIVTVTFYNLHYTVIGEVGSPGVYPITDDKITLIDALAKAGDLTILGKRDAVYVTRTENGKRTTSKVDLRTTDLYNSPVYFLQQDDVIYVEPNGVRAGQSAINENSFKSVAMWMSIASFLMSLSVFIFRR